MHHNQLISRKFSNLSNINLPSLINAKIRAFVQQGKYLEALQLYTGIETSFSPQKPDKFTLPSLLKACAALSDQNHGKKIHSTIITMGLQSDPYIVTSLINMYVKCGSLSNANQVFVKISESESLIQDVTLWNSIIDGYFRYGRIDDGFFQFRRMKLVGVRPDAYSLSILLGACNNLSDHVERKSIHGYIVRNMSDGDPFLETALIDMYMKCGRTMEAWCVFDKLKDKSNIVLWNAMIGGFGENGLWEKSFELFSLLKNVNFKVGSATFSTVLTACSHCEDLQFGREVHCDVIKMGFDGDPYVCTSLLTMYARCRLLKAAQIVFHGLSNKEIEVWNAMISAYINNDCIHEALDNYYQMRLSGFRSDSFSISNVLSACSMIDSYDFGSKIHGELIKRPIQSNMAVKSALLTMYAKCGYLEDANLVFSSMKERDAVAWGSMLSGLSQHKKFEEALSLFKVMKFEGIKSDSTILTSVIGASAGLEYVEMGLGVHGFVIKNGTGLDVFVGSALIDMYAKFGLPDMSRSVFTDMRHRNLVAWNSLISCYSRNSLPEMSISLFPQIVQHGFTPDSVSITNALVAISSLSALLKGKVVHGCQIRLEIQLDLQVENALIVMYIKCGCIGYAFRIFENMPRRNIVTWNSMIAGYGSHGDCPKAIRLFDEMRRSVELPDEITFLALISACSHSGMIEEGLGLFQSMREDYGIEPRMEHYVDVVDLLGRAGHLNEAYDFIQTMPIEPDKSVWLCLLCSCRTHRNVVLGELAATKLLKLEPTRTSNYVQLLNLYREGEFWDKAAKLRVLMKEKGLRKNPGCSWIELKDRVDVFFSWDSSSSKTQEIYATLSNLNRNMEGEESYHEDAGL